MRRLEIQISSLSGRRERSVQVGRLGSIVISGLAFLVAIAFVIAALVLGYVVMGLVVAILVVVVVVALIRGVFRSLQS